MHPLPAGQLSSGESGTHRQHNAADGDQSRGAANRTQSLWVGLQARQEHQEHDADVTEVPDELIVPDESERYRPDYQSSDKDAENGGHAEAEGDSAGNLRCQ